MSAMHGPGMQAAPGIYTDSVLHRIVVLIGTIRRILLDIKAIPGGPWLKMAWYTVAKKYYSWESVQ